MIDLRFGAWGMLFCSVPLFFPSETKQFTQKGLHQRPSFFGCHDHEKSPLIIYFPNYFAASPTDISTVSATYTVSEVTGFFLKVWVRKKKDGEVVLITGCEVNLNCFFQFD